MSEQIAIDLGSAVPVFEQIRAQLAGLIGVGELTGGTRLPTVRALAADLGVAVNTVGRAYSELEAAGLISTRRRLGTVVLGGNDTVMPPDILAAADALAAAVVASGVSDAAALEHLRAVLRGHRRTR